jgi:hypothetical protein
MYSYGAVRTAHYSTTMAAYVNAADGVDTTADWRSSNTRVVTVDQRGADIAMPSAAYHRNGNCHIPGGSAVPSADTR